MNLRVLCCYLAFLAAGLSAVPRSTASDSFDVAVLDKLLSGVTPGQKLMKVGDMRFKVEVMRAWREYLARQESGRGPRAAFEGGVQTWTGGIVPYAFDADVTAEHRQAFRDAAGEWEAFAKLQFVPRAAEADYIQIRNRAEPGGDSAVGRIGGMQLMNIGSWNRGTLTHEIGHALGLVHEHQRSDRDTYVTILTANIVPGTEANFIKLPGSQNKGTYDFESSMHYVRNALSIDPDNLDTIVPKPAYAAFYNVMGQQNFDRALSRLDRIGMATLYGAPVIAPSSVVTNTRDSGPGSLRAAIYYGIDHPGTTVTFAIPAADPGFAGGVFTIRPSDQMTRLGINTTINGASQPGNTNPAGPEVVLDGGQAEYFSHGIILRESGCTVRGLVISNWQGYGVLISGGTGNAVRGCFIGASASGAAAEPNGFAGVGLDGGASGNTIGGVTAPDRNVISGNAGQGILMIQQGTTGNAVIGNYIGLNAAGNAAIPNEFAGISVFDGSGGNRIGEATAGAGNVISGNGSQGITLSDGSSGNLIAGNLVGLNAAGTAAVPNGWSGVDLFGGAVGNTVGGSTPAAANVISGNTHAGLLLSGSGTDDNQIRGNLIGLNAAGDSALPNGWSGMSLFAGASGNIIGGNLPGQGNVIAGNGNQGIALSDATTRANRLEQNIIGLNRAGSAPLGNSWSGVELYNGAADNFIGPGNVIAGNLNYGIVLSGDSDGNDITGNLIGLKSGGIAPAGNGWAGVGLFSEASANRIGGIFPHERNVISGNGNQGIVIGNAGTDFNVVRNNLIGLDSAGTNPVPNGWSGVDIFGGAAENIVGGTTPGMRNFIAANGNYGVILSGAGTHDNEVSDNSIGLTVFNASAGNTWSGVALFNGAVNNRITGNRIASNLLRGVDLGDATTTGNAILGNSFSANGGLAIDLFGGAGDGFGITANDALDADTGPNNLQNRPELSTAVLTTVTTVQGMLASTPSTVFRVEFFASPAADPSGSGEGQTYLGALTTVTTNSAGSASFSTALTAVVPAGQRITATATDPDGNTSEFSVAVTVTAADSDNDGMPNAFESANSLNSALNDAALDTDGDGFSNYDEFLAGTGVRNSSSRPAMSVSTTAENIRMLGLSTVAGKIYRIEYSAAPAAGQWIVLAENLVGTGTDLAIADPVGSAARRFYRAVTVP